MKILLNAALAACMLLPAPGWTDNPPTDTPIPLPPAPPPSPLPAAPIAEKPAWTKWFNPASAPFIPVPLIATDPNSGLTVGLIPTWLTTDENHDISKIIAPDIQYNPNFGLGVHGRIFAYSSADAQWSLIGGLKERVEREFDGEYEIGRAREGRWSVSYSLIYDRNGSTRFYGIGNLTRRSAQTNYTQQQDMAQVQLGFNLSHAWQILYTAREKVIDVLPGTLTGVPSIQTRFPGTLGTNPQLLNRISLVYDSRDDTTIPTHGMKWVVYAGAASKQGVFNDSSYSEAGIDGRGVWPVAPDIVLAAHLSLRYLLTAKDVPFWALSSLGGGQVQIGGEQPLRGFGDGRFYDRDSFSSTVELRRKVFTFDAVTTKLDIEVAPFVDFGRVFAHSNTNPLFHVHPVVGAGFRGIARPFVVGYVDIGFGSEGPAVFTGLNYPF